jgi:AcrR family transcriptional regulator
MAATRSSIHGKHMTAPAGRLPGRGDATRTRILDAARRRFGRDGYERATIRAIAAHAGVDPKLVMRYFGNKEALFAEAADFDLRLPDLAELPADRIGATLVSHFLARWEHDDSLHVLLRAAVTHEGAAERMRSIFATQMAPALARMGADRTSAPVRAGLISSQILGFAFCRYVLRLPPIVALSRAEAVRWLGPVAQRYAGGQTS